MKWICINKQRWFENKMEYKPTVKVNKLFLSQDEQSACFKSPCSWNYYSYWLKHKKKTREAAFNLNIRKVIEIHNMNGSSTMDLPGSGYKGGHWIFSSFGKRGLKVISRHRRTESVFLFETRRARVCGSAPPKKSSFKNCWREKKCLGW